MKRFPVTKNLPHDELHVVLHASPPAVDHVIVEERKGRGEFAQKALFFL